MIRGPFYRAFAPRPELRGHVETVWVQEHPSAPGAAPTAILPAGRVELVVSYGDPFERLDPGASPETAPGRPGRWRAQPQAALGGQRTRPLTVRARGATGLVVVGFRPWAAGALLGADARGLREEFAAVADRFGDGAERRLLDAVAAAPDARARVDAVQRFLVRRLCDREIDRAGRAAALRIEAGWGRDPVERTAAELGIGRRQLHRRLAQATGLAPKAFASVIRFQKAVGSLRRGDATADVIARCGYADQAHLAHELRARGGLPATFWRRAGIGAEGEIGTENGIGASALASTFNRAEIDGFYNTVYVEAGVVEVNGLRRRRPSRRRRAPSCGSCAPS